jgi:hypothetical protein
MVVKSKFDLGVSFVKDRLLDDDFPVKLGFETELHILDSNLRPAPQEVVQEIIGEDPVGRATELCGNQIELKTEPINGFSLDKLFGILKAQEDRLSKDLEEEGLKTIRIGALPNVNPHDVIVTNLERYHLVPGFHDQWRGEHIETLIGGVDFACAKAVGLFSSVQLNLQARSLEDGVDKVNRSLMIGPYVTALTGNARVVDGVDTGYNDIRMLAWERSHDIRSITTTEKRVGLPSTYYQDFEDYAQRIRERSFIFDLRDADPIDILLVGFGLNWRDTRLKIVKDNGGFRPVVEFRVMSTQPTIEEDLAGSMFYLGRLHWSQMTGEELNPHYAFNRDQTLRFGMQAQIYDGGRLISDLRTLLLRELSRAEDGLVDLGFDRKECQGYLGLLRARSEPPSSKFAREFNQFGLEEAIHRYMG